MEDLTVVGLTTDRQYLLLAGRDDDGETVLYKTSGLAIAATVPGREDHRWHPLPAPVQPAAREASSRTVHAFAPATAAAPSAVPPVRRAPATRRVPAARHVPVDRRVPAPADRRVPAARAVPAPIDDAALDIVERWYLRRGFTVAERRWSGRDVAVDLIVRRGGLIVFCDVVRARSQRRPDLDPAARGRVHRLQSQWATHQVRQVTRLRYDLACFVGEELVVHAFDA